MIWFDNCDVAIGGSGIMSDSASIEVNNELEPIYSLGRKGIGNQSPNGPIRANFRISYYCELSNEPSFKELNGIKSLTGFNYSGVQIEIGGITGYNCYLTDYSVRAQPNSLTRASVSYASFTEPSGQISNKKGVIQYNLSGAFAHGWSTYILTTTGFLTAPTYNFDYTFNANWTPIYILGQQHPLQVNLLDAHERMTLVRESFYNINFSGENPIGRVFDANEYPTVKFLNLGFCCDTADSGCQSLTFNVSGARIINSTIDGNLDDFVKSSTVIQKHY